jgi:circadian clock protein KaiB
MSGECVVSFRLYVAGDGQNSARAIANLKALCEARLADRHEIELIDVFAQPQRALADGIVMTPTLVRLAPGPIRRVVGTLQETEHVVAALGLVGADG